MNYGRPSREEATVYVVGSLVFVFIAALVVVSFVSMRRRRGRFEDDE